MRKKPNNLSAEDLADFPDEVQEIIKPHLVQSDDVLSAIGVALAEKRDEAKAARTASGIETTWLECEEAYIGIDDANRHEFQDAKWSKPMSVDGPVTTGKAPRQTDMRSTAYVRLTSRYVDAGTAKMGEILLPADDKAFSFSETPVPDLISAKEDTSQVFHEGLGVPLTRAAQPGEIAPPAPPGAPALPPPPAIAAPAAPVTAVPGTAPAAPAAVPPASGQPAAPAAPQVPVTVKDFAEEAIEIARKSAHKAETRIYDWMVDCQYQAEMRIVIHDSARIGVGILNGPVPISKKQVVVQKPKGGGVNITFKNVVKPGVRWCDPWNIFPDPACGENIKGGNYVFERDFMSEREVRALKKLPGYIAAQIDKVIEEGPEKVNKDNDLGAGGSPRASTKKGRFEIWYYVGSLKRDEMCACWEAAGKDSSTLPGDDDEVFAVVTMINDCVVKATINPLDSGSIAYHSVPWQRRAGHWAGIGVAEQLRMPQKTVNAATRAMLNNAGKSAGCQIVVDRDAITPADGSWTITPDKIWYKKSDVSQGSVDDAFAIHVIQNVTQQLMEIVNYGMTLAEESTSIPLITQGQSGATTPDTLGAANLQNNNANQLLRSIGYAFDDYITEPVVRQFYEWLLLDPEVPDDEKAEYTINAHGSIALVERAIQDQTISQMAPLVQNPAYGLDPKKWIKLFLQSKRIDPALVQYTDEEMEKISSQPPPEPPAVTVAKIAQQTALTELASKQTADQQSLASEQRIADATATLESGKVQNQATQIAINQQAIATENTIKLHQLQMEHERGILQYATMHQIKIEDVKAELAKTAMQLQVQQELNAVDNAAVHHVSAAPGLGVPQPPIQLPGRAAPGHAFDQA